MVAALAKSFSSPRINSNPTDTTLPFEFRRRQFPLRLAFAMTINKAQGQTLRMAGPYLPTRPFSHVQLYVAKTRVGAKYVLCEWSSSVARSKTKKESMSRTLFIRSCCNSDACEETVMHVKSHDQVLNALEPVPYSLFFSVELYLILQSVMITVSS